MDPVVGCCLCVPIVIVLSLRWYITRAPLCPNNNKLTGKIVLVTGSTSGIGRATASECARRDATVVLACRDRSKAEATVTAIRHKTGNEKVHYLPLDLSCCQNVADFAMMYQKQFGNSLDVLVNNAAYMGPKKRSKDRLDLIFQTNVLGPFLLTNLLTQRNQPGSSPLMRIINVVSDSLKLGKVDLDDLMFEKRPYNMYSVYGASKLALLLLTMETNFRFGDQGVIATAVHPGPVKSGLLRYWPGLFGDVLRLVARLLFRTPEQGAQSVVYAATIEDLSPYQGKVIYDCREWALDAWCRNRDYKVAEKLWQICQALCGNHISEPNENLTEKPSEVKPTTVMARS